MRPVWNGKEFAPRLILPLSLSYDHRVIDGATAARFSTYLVSVLSDIRKPDVSGVEVLRAAKAVDKDILGIMITAFASTETAVEAMRLGACDYLSKPFDVDLLRMKVREKIENRQLRQENVLLKRTLGLSHQFSSIIGRSEAMLDVFKMIETVAKTNSGRSSISPSRCRRSRCARRCGGRSCRR